MLFTSGGCWLSVCVDLPLSLLLQEQKDNSSNNNTAKEEFFLIPDIFNLVDKIELRFQPGTKYLILYGLFHFFNYLFQVFTNFRHCLPSSLHFSILVFIND